MDMASIRAIMARKVMGVPIAVFVLIGTAVLLFVAIKMKNSSSSDTTDVATQDAPASDGSQDDTTQQPDFTATDTGVGTATPVVTTTTTNDTNDMWKRRTIEWLMGNGYSVEIATSAISKYLNGDQLTTEEAKARDAAVAQFGLPPEDIPDTVPTPNPPTSSDPGSPPILTPPPVNPPLGSPTPPILGLPIPTPTTPGTHTNPPVTKPINPPRPLKQGVPPLTHTVRGANDNTYAELASLYYGSNSKDNVNEINAANPKKNPPFRPGDKIHIPAHTNPKYFVTTGATHELGPVARKNGITVAALEQLNPGTHWPVKVGTRVRVK